MPVSVYMYICFFTCMSDICQLTNALVCPCVCCWLLKKRPILVSRGRDFLMLVWQPNNGILLSGCGNNNLPYNGGVEQAGGGSWCLVSRETDGTVEKGRTQKSTFGSGLFKLWPSPPAERLGSRLRNTGAPAKVARMAGWRGDEAIKTGVKKKRTQ